MTTRSDNRTSELGRPTGEARVTTPAVDTVAREVTAAITQRLGVRDAILSPIGRRHDGE